jgi:protein TonB
VRQADLSDTSLLAFDKTALPDDGRRDPVPVSRAGRAEFADAAAALRLDPKRVAFDREVPRRRDRLLGGPLGSLLFHLLPVLALGIQLHDPSENAMPIPIQLVFQEPPPPAPAEPKAAAAKPPPGRRASEDVAETVAPEISRTDKGSPLPDPGEPKPPSPETEPVLVAPPMATPLMPIPFDTHLGEGLPRAAETQTAAVAPPPAPIPKAAPSKERVAVLTPKPLGSSWPLPLRANTPGEVPRTAHLHGLTAVRDEYCAEALRLTLRQMGLLPRSLTGSRQGTTLLHIRVLGDGTIGDVRVTRSSGFPDIDERIERMVNAVGRYPPLPTWMGAFMDFTLSLHFPHLLQR